MDPPVLGRVRGEGLWVGEWMGRRTSEWRTSDGGAAVSGIVGGRIEGNQPAATRGQWVAQEGQANFGGGEGGKEAGKWVRDGEVDHQYWLPGRERHTPIIWRCQKFRGSGCQMI